ncbi:MAG: hypothetical protein J2O44_06090, partial [Porphyrobacter sp.]|nr:hypothetical protein [Porphyrobacter sp.]
MQEAIPPEVRPIAEAAGAPKRADIEAARHIAEEPPAHLPSAANDNEPAAAPSARAVGDIEEGAAPRRKEGTNEPVAKPEDQDIRQRTHGEDPEKTGEYPAYKPKTLEEHFADPDPRPAPIFVTADLSPELLKGKPSIPGHSEITASNPHSEAAALANYHALRLADPHREVSIIRCIDPQHPNFGEYRVFQGGAESVSRPPDGWVSDRHAHPLLGEGTASQRLARSLPTGTGGDFAVMQRELDVQSGLVQSAQGARRDSIIDIRLGDQHAETHFSITRNGDGYDYHVSFRPPHDGVEHMGPFHSIAEYEEAATKLTGIDFSARSENDSYRTAGANVTAEPPRPAHGDPVTASMRQDIEFIQQRMALAGEFEGQIKGATPRGELDPSLGRAATLSDAHERVIRMGLVGEPDSMIRLHNILNDDSIPVPVRALISDTTLAATRNELLRTGQLAPGEPLVLLFHGASPEKTKSLISEGVDMARGPGGPHDDFGEGLYLTRSLESALAYREARSGQLPGDPPGGVIPYMLRGRELANSVDVSSRGALREQWEAFAVANAKTLLEGGKVMMSEGVMKVALGQVKTFADFDSSLIENRGKMFNDFLASIGANPSVIFGDLGGPLTNGIQLREVTDQVVIRSKEIADIMNEQHVRKGTREPGSAIGGGEDLQQRTVGLGPMVLAPIEHLNEPQLKNRVDNAFDAMAPGSQPRRPEDLPAGMSLKDPAVAANEQARRDALVAHVVAEVSARRGPEAADRLTELLIIGGEPMARALRSETERGMARALDSLPDSLAKPLSLTPTQRSELIDLMRARAA